MPDNAIRMIPGYQTKDGQQFHTLEQAQEHTRRELFRRAYDQMAAKNTAFYGLPKELFVDVMMIHGRALSTIILDDLSPKDEAARAEARTIYQEAAESMGETVFKDPRPTRSPESLARALADAPRFPQGGIVGAAVRALRPDPVKSRVTSAAALEAELAHDLAMLDLHTA